MAQETRREDINDGDDKSMEASTMDASSSEEAVALVSMASSSATGTDLSFILDDQSSVDASVQDPASSNRHKTCAESPPRIGSPETKKRKRKKTLTPAGTGRWTATEHEAFLRGVQEHGREWKLVAKVVGTRTPAQARSHAQKYFTKQERQQQQQSIDTATRILLAHPETVQKEVQDTLAQLRERYRQLQLQLQQNQPGGEHYPVVIQDDNNDEEEKITSQQRDVQAASKADKELIALNVLQQCLPNST